ncbi:30S ribosomal protein S19e [Candidatus Woesearchaeota archaeon]|nr:30S ribosomal protein S19e [Candidatus Woesearchaeota archaeon]
MAIHDVNPTLLIERAAQELKKDATFKAPVWAKFVKTGMSRERSPMQPDWWHIREAAVMRKIFLLGPIGTSKLRVKFGGRKNEGMAPEHVYMSAGNHLRKMLQQLEKAGFAKQTQKGVHKGRVLTRKGQAFLEKIATDLLKEQGITFAPKAEKPKAAEKTAEAGEVKVKKPRAPRKKKEVEVPATPQVTDAK